MKLAILERLETVAQKNIIELEKAREQGRMVAGLYCLYSPYELVVAAGGIPVSLCGTRNEPIAAAEKILPRNLCPLIKSSFGFAATDTCPFFHHSDIVIAETTCDGKKKMFELLAEYRPVHVLQLPQNQDPERALPYWLAELERLRVRLEEQFGVVITKEKLSEAIRLMNRERMALKELMDLAREDPSPLTGLEMLTVKFRAGFLADKELGIQLIGEAVAETRERQARGGAPFARGTRRILLTGTPVGLGSEKVIRIIEECGASVVAFESCGGYKRCFTVEENGDPLRAIAEQYLKVPCPCMSPNPGRFELLGSMIGDFRVEGVVDLTWQACHAYNIESHAVGRFVEEEHHLPFLQIETDYSDSDTERLRVRIEAFLELMG